MGIRGPRVFDVNELSDVDSQLRRAARTVADAAEDLTVTGGGLPPEAFSVVAVLPGLRGRLNRAADQLTTAAGEFGRLGADIRRLDALGWLFRPLWEGLRNTVVPPGDYGPFGPYPWWAGRGALVASAGVELLRSRFGYRHWVTDPSKRWPLFADRHIHPLKRVLIDRAARFGNAAGTAATFADTVSRRMKDGEDVPDALAGSAGESATVVGCAVAGAKIGAAAPIPHPAVKAGAVIVGGVAGTTICSKPGRWIGDRASDSVGFLRDKISKLKPPSVHLPWS